MQFHDRRHAGALLAERLQSFSFVDPIVIALPRGGVPVAYEVAQRLRVPLDVLVVRKLGAPVQPEYGIGAVTEGGFYWVDPEKAYAAGVTEVEFEKVLKSEEREVERRIQSYRPQSEMKSVKGKTVIIVDDGLATGSTAKVACSYLKKMGAAKMVLAVPVCSPKTVQRLKSEVDELVCVDQPYIFLSVSQFYEDFSQVSDDEVRSLLNEVQPSREVFPRFDRPVTLVDGDVHLEGHLSIPASAQGIVIFAHGSGSSRLSTRNKKVAKFLNEAGIGTLLFDLLTEEESQNLSQVFDIPFLAYRLGVATEWIKNHEACKDLPIGFFGASTGAGAALWAAADLGRNISAIVCRGGRPDLAIPRLKKVTASTLLLVGSRDEPVIGMNREALGHLERAKLVIIPGATHLFEEPGCLETIAKDALSWFALHFIQARIHQEVAS